MLPTAKTTNKMRWLRYCLRYILLGHGPNDVDHGFLARVRRLVWAAQLAQADILGSGSAARCIPDTARVRRADLGAPSPFSQALTAPLYSVPIAPFILTRILVTSLAFASAPFAEGADEAPLYKAWIRVADLIKKCDGDKAWEQAYCVGYVTGVADVANNDRTPLKVCIPTAITQTQMKTVVMKYLTQHGDESEYAAFSSVRAALREAFPCQPRRMM
jgi:Rap1a immunity proteins